jgi:hypothetical protein
MKKSTTFNFSNTKTIITYDLSPCSISSQDICDEDSRLHNSISVEDEGRFDLPNTTLRTYLNKKDAEEAFRQAVYAANKYETITKMLIIEVDGKNGFIENNE